MCYSNWPKICKIQPIMIVGIRILGHGKVAHEWSVFIVDKGESLDEIFRKIKNGKLTCGRKIELDWVDETNVTASTWSSSGVPSDQVMQPTPLTPSPHTC